MRNFALQIASIGISARKYLELLEREVILSETVEIKPLDTLVKIKAVNKFYATDTNNWDYELSSITYNDLALLADAVSKIIEK